MFYRKVNFVPSRIGDRFFHLKDFEQRTFYLYFLLTTVYVSFLSTHVCPQARLPAAVRERTAAEIEPSMSRNAGFDENGRFDEILSDSCWAN